MKNTIKVIAAFSALVMIGVFSPVRVMGQSEYQPYSYQFYQKLNDTLYAADKRIHTSLKPYLITSALRKKYDSLMNQGSDTSRKSWIFRKLFNEHLIDIKNEQYSFYADFLPDLQIGRDFKSNKPTWLNTRGYQFGLNIGDRFSFYTNGYENQALFAPYVHDFINQYKVVPGQSIKDFDPANKITDYSYVSALMSYTAIKEHLNITLAYDKNFIGDGYRSLFLSDISTNYTSVKLTGELGNVQYMSMWSYMIDPMAPRTSTDRGVASQYKWGAFQYLDWNISTKLSLGLFQSVLWSPANTDGSYRGFNLNYLNPVIFLRPIDTMDPNSPDKIHLGFSGKYKPIKNTVVYGQFQLDDFKAKEFFGNRGFSHNKWAAQLGFKGFNAFGVNKLNYLAEYNLARPYTYSHFQGITNYSNYSQSLAHPFGANFREYLSIWNYSSGRFDFQCQGIYGRYGLDENGSNYGKDIFQSYDENVPEYGNRIGQGVATKLFYTETRVAFLINPKYNLRLEAGYIYRNEVNKLYNNHTSLFTIGLRSTFRNLYYDF
nr:gliding motility protein RemB [Pedobacter panaciterrae]